MPAWFETDEMPDRPFVHAVTTVAFMSDIVEVEGVMLDELDCRRSSCPSSMSCAALRIPSSRFLLHRVPRGL